ncbi:leucine-rich repeat and death domain-containing protein 1-like [Aphis craccivora]|uniref:Leucine-rich repeat and death domain-containing protein 1-like n=1 Tax=Aphis craccivora TaxID=307492 RepID=A0A6G0Y1L7_APHCR|nr:leucine-rich repeat and death domain-containing protein 1-like [Aphis craccivora]
MLFQCGVNVRRIRGDRMIGPDDFITSTVWIKKENSYYLCLKNSIYPNGKAYRITYVTMDPLFFSLCKWSKIVFEFKKPREILYFEIESKRLAYVFCRTMRDIMIGKNVIIDTNQNPDALHANNAAIDNFDLNATELKVVDNFDNRILNMKCLSTLVLEDCKSLVLPEEIGHLPIKSLNISGSEMPTSQHAKDIYWNWTSKPTISGTLTTLKMDSIGLTRLPFEILYMKNLQTLSINNNQLEYLPHFIGELAYLKNLFVADNMLVYFPHCLSFGTIAEIDIIYNCFHSTELYDHLITYKENIKEPTDFKLLKHIAFFNLMDNLPQLKRQDIPRSLWEYFNYVGRCTICWRWTLPDYCNITCIKFWPLGEKTNMALHLFDEGPTWQLMNCTDKNDCEAHEK